MMKYEVHYTNKFKKQYKKILKQGKEIKKLKMIVLKLANGEELPPEFRNHRLYDNKYYRNCFECHIEADWLLIYTIEDSALVLVLQSTGSHSELFY